MNSATRVISKHGLPIVSICSILSFLFLTLIVASYPFRLFLGFSQIDPLKIIPNPYLYSLIFSVWVASFLSISYLNRDRAHMVGICVALASLVFGIITYKMEPLGVDHEYGISLSNLAYLKSFHHIPWPFPAQVGYLAYPAISLFLLTISNLVGLSSVTAASFLQIALYVSAGWSVYRLTKRIIASQFGASLSVILFFAFSLEAGSFTLVFPATFGVTLFANMLTLILPNPTKSSMVAMLIIFAAMALTHFYDPLDIIFILATLIILGKKYNMNLGLQTLFTIITILYASYLTFFAVNYFNSLIPGFYMTFENILRFHSFGYALTVARSNTLLVPFWVTMVRYLDLVLTSIIGWGIGVWLLIGKQSKHIPLARFYALGVLGVSFFGLAALMASLGSGGGFDLLIAPQFDVFFAIPLLIFVASKYRYAILVLSLIAVTLAAPSMIALTYHQISTIAVYPDEIESARYFVTYQVPGALVLTDPKTAGIIGSFEPLINFSYFGTPIYNFTSDPNYYTLIYTPYSYYQMHQGFPPIGRYVLKANNIVFDDGTMFMIPPTI